MAENTYHTFDEVCKIAKATPAERTAAAWFLASLRMRKTIEALLPISQDTIKGGIDGLRHWHNVRSMPHQG